MGGKTSKLAESLESVPGPTRTEAEAAIPR